MLGKLITCVWPSRRRDLGREGGGRKVKELQGRREERGREGERERGSKGER